MSPLIGSFVLAAVMFTHSVFAAAPSSVTAAGPLGAEQLQGIRNVSRSVLESRREAAEDADALALRDALRALHEAVGETLSVQTPSIVIQPRGTPGRRTGRAATLATELPAALAANVRGGVDALKSRRQRLEERAGQIGIQSGDRDSNPARNRLDALAAVASNLEVDTERALRATGRERFEQLANLHRRLAPQALDERIRALTVAGDPVALPTPTLITITEHR